MVFVQIAMYQLFFGFYWWWTTKYNYWHLINQNRFLKQHHINTFFLLDRKRINNTYRIIYFSDLDFYKYEKLLVSVIVSVKIHLAVHRVNQSRIICYFLRKNMSSEYPLFSLVKIYESFIRAFKRSFGI